MSEGRSWHRKAVDGRPNRYHFWNETYRQGLVILFPCTAEQLKKEYEYIDKDSPFSEDDFGLSEARFLAANGYHVIGFVDDKPEVGTIAHEALHYVNHVLHKVEVQVSSENDEAQCYFLQWAVNKIYNATRGIK